jgi:hypothetical protein
VTDSSSDSANVVTFQTAAERDREILQLRLAGISISQIARRYRCKEKTVVAALDAQLPLLDNETRFRYLREAVSQLDQLTAWWWTAAKTSATATNIILKINEQRAQLLGLNAPAKIDLVRVNEAPPPMSTEELLSALNRIAAEQVLTTAKSLISFGMFPSAARRGNAGVTERHENGPRVARSPRTRRLVGLCLVSAATTPGGLRPRA